MWSFQQKNYNFYSIRVTKWAKRLAKQNKKEKWYNTSALDIQIKSEFLIMANPRVNDSFSNFITTMPHLKQKDVLHNKWGKKKLLNHNNKKIVNFFSSIDNCRKKKKKDNQKRKKEASNYLIALLGGKATSNVFQIKVRGWGPTI